MAKKKVRQLSAEEIEKRMKRLINLGKKSGYVTYDDIDKHFPPEAEGFSDEMMDKVYEELERNGIAFCSVSSSKLPEELIQTADFLYVRFHGRKGGHRYDYSEEELKRWAKKLKGVPAKEVYAYFNNDYNAYAPHNCLKLTELLEVRPYPEEP